MTTPDANAASPGGRQALYLITQPGLGPGWLRQDILLERVDWQVRATLSILGSSESCANLGRPAGQGQDKNSELET